VKLKPQPRPTRRPPRTTTRPARRGARPAGRQARRPGTPLRRRLAGRLPSIRRVLAGVGAVALAAGLTALLNGPWLRVSQVTWAGEHWTGGEELASALAPARGASVLAVDTAALAERLRRLPSVADATVTASLTGSIEATVVEREAAFAWHARSTRFLGAADGTIFAAIGDDAPIPDELAAIPVIHDARFAARLVSVGDVIPAEILETAMRLVSMDPAALGSRAERLSVGLDDEYGFRLASADPAWEVALGVYGLDPTETAAEAAARLERQVTAVRTLFAAEPEAEIDWVDVRNPGKVYFRAKG
jgi:cell division septal protein FtsQ